MPGWPNYVALGDSLTAGRDDYSTEGGRIGWARRLAAILGARTGVPCSLTNLAEDQADQPEVSIEVGVKGRRPRDLALAACLYPYVTDPGEI